MDIDGEVAFSENDYDQDVNISDLQTFAALVAAVEREECAQMAEHVMYGRDGCDRTAAAIRARGQA
jgi:hypothetical protein